MRGIIHIHQVLWNEYTIKIQLLQGKTMRTYAEIYRMDSSGSEVLYGSEDGADRAAYDLALKLGVTLVQEVDDEA